MLVEKYYVFERGEFVKVVWGEIIMEVNFYEIDKFVKCFYIIWMFFLSNFKECFFILG